MSTDNAASSNVHILIPFEQALRSLRDDARTMARLAERNLENARQGLFGHDEQQCNAVIANDDEVDALEVKIDHECVDIIVRFHPLASDMREVVSTMRFSGSLERIADRAVSIARRSRKLVAGPAIVEMSHLEPIFAHAQAMVRDAVCSFAERDLPLASRLKERDNELDQMNDDFAERLTQVMAHHVHMIPSYVDLIVIAKFLKRVGDQATNIGEDVVYAISAQEIRHIHDQRLKKL
jgi:phosphate transport system protein